MAQTESDYPIQFSVDYPDRDLNRLTTLVRIFTVIPIAIVLAAVSGGSTFSGAARDETFAFSVGAGGILVFAPLLLIVVRQKYPRWWFDWNLNLARFENRVFAYAFLLRDEYPSTDEEQAVRLELPYPDARNDLNRWLPIVKWLLAIPHYVVLLFLAIAAFVCVVIAWFAILFTGRYPRGLFDFVVSVMRWGNRVQGYAFLLVTDRYPPFSLAP